MNIPVSAKEITDCVKRQPMSIPYAKEDELANNHGNLCVLMCGEPATLLLHPNQCNHSACVEIERHSCHGAYFCAKCAGEVIIRSSSGDNGRSSIFGNHPSCPLCKKEFCPVDCFTPVKWEFIGAETESLKQQLQKLQEEIKKKDEKLKRYKKDNKTLLRKRKTPEPGEIVECQ